MQSLIILNMFYVSTSIVNNVILMEAIQNFNFKILFILFAALLRFSLP